MTNCVEQLISTCWPQNPLDVLRVWNIVYGIPNAVTLGVILGVIIAAIYVWNRSLNILAILGIYTITIVGSTWANDALIQPVYHTVVYIIALSIASLLVILVLKTLRE